MTDTLSGVFAALADPTRRGLFEELTGRPGGATATELARTVPVTRQAVVKHLQTLVRSGLAETRRDGREVLYVARLDPAAAASGWIERRAAAWEDRLAGLATRIAEGRALGGGAP